MNIKNKLIAVSGAVTGVLTSAGMAMAQPEFSPLTPEQSGFKITDFGLLINSILQMVMFVAALLVFAYLIWGGIQWITSGGDKGKTEEARNKITAAIVGLVILAASYAIFQLVLWFLGIDDPTKGIENFPRAVQSAVRSIQLIA